MNDTEIRKLVRDATEPLLKRIEALEGDEPADRMAAARAAKAAKKAAGAETQA